ncbi:MAG: DUF362 domain-containing protein [bacterium]|nr:DUF362 domain-containing protein [bacterium]
MVRKKVLIKPNVVKDMAPPVTTRIELVAAIADYVLESFSPGDVYIADGTGSLEYDTFHAFEKLGFSKIAKERGIKLLDLNEERLVKLSKPELKRWPEMHLPEIVMDSFLISVPTLKAHTLAGVTLSMKNMVGICPPSHYCKQGHWKKAAFHSQIHEAVADLNRYRSPDFTVLDASLGMMKGHIYGVPCDPPIGIIAASEDPVAIDAYGCGLLGVDPGAIDHITMVDGELGRMKPLNIVKG